MSTAAFDYIVGISIEMFRNQVSSVHQLTVCEHQASMMKNHESILPCPAVVLQSVSSEVSAAV